MLGEAKAIDLLDDGLKGTQADAFEGYLTTRRTAFTRLANTEVIQDSTVVDTQVVVRALVSGRVGLVTTNDLSLEGLRQARDRAAWIARSGAGKDYPCGFSDDRTRLPSPTDTFDDHTAQLGPGERKHHLEDSLQKARRAGLLLAGSYQTRVVETAVWNTLGLARYFTGTKAGANFTALEGLQPGQSTGFAADFNVAARKLDLEALTQRAIDKVLLGANPIDLPPDRYDVILEPAAVAELIEWLSYIGFSSKSIQEKTSFLVDRMNQAVTGPNVTLVDDGLDNPADKVPFDVEGTVKQRTLLIDAGVARAQVYDRLHGFRSGCASTGHAVGVGVGSDPGAIPSSLCLNGGQDTQGSLMDKVERGLWITRFHYVNGMLHPKRAMMTGLTRDGTFLIRDGRLVRGVHNLRFTDSVLEAFARIDGLTAERATLPNWWADTGSVTAPTLLIRGLKFTGKTTLQ